ncbi:200 kDa antigen p200 [Striga asiatica]|uniref:200 kDa antigen p200 n=1 Tax=Striga asiatica TaxID=4170 RepID=A0A5A7PEZ7_STRAF|nr:200 kDa antigen p200 [Striga asiatica]
MAVLSTFLMDNLLSAPGLAPKLGLKPKAPRSLTASSNLVLTQSAPKKKQKYLNLDNFTDLFGIKRLENNVLVDPVHKLRPESLSRQLNHLPLHHLVNRVLPILRIPKRLQNIMRPDIRRHDQNRVCEAHSPPLRIRNPPIIQQLQQDIKNIVVRFLDLVKKYNRVRPAPYNLSQLPTFLIPNISRWRPH